MSALPPKADIEAVISVASTAARQSHDRPCPGLAPEPMSAGCPLYPARGNESSREHFRRQLLRILILRMRRIAKIFSAPPSAKTFAFLGPLQPGLIAKLILNARAGLRVERGQLHFTPPPI
jgi:hypothetical protein